MPSATDTPSGTFSHQLPTTSSQKVDVPDCDYRHVLPPLLVRQGFESLGWSAQGDRRETASMLLARVRGVFCRQDQGSSGSRCCVLMHLLVLGAF